MVTDGLTPHDTIKEVLNAVVKAKVPVVMEFVSSDLETVIDIYYGSGPLVKLILNQENVDAGLGEFLQNYCY